ncbi:MAG: hypothetical protein AB7E70_20310 [Hyphomicrobiaceae bacterium]
MTTAEQRAKADEIGAELAKSLSVGRIRREGRTFVVPSRTRVGLFHRVTLTLDNVLICNCEAASLGKRECWAVALVREEIAMTTETPPTTETALVPVQLTPPQALLPTPAVYAAIDRAAQLALAGAIALPKEMNTREKVAAAMLYGYELGLRPMTAIKHLHVIEGRVQPSAQVLAGLLKSRTDAQISIVESTDKKCTLRLVWPSRGVNETWTTEWPEVERAKLATKDNWSKYPRAMLIWHTTRNMLRVFAPDVINGLDIGPAVEWQPDESDEEVPLYNEGDEPEQKPYIEGQVVDTSTGEIKDESPRTTDEQLKAMDRWQKEIEGLYPKDEALDVLNRIGLRARKEFPYAIEDRRLKRARFFEPDAQTFIGWLREAAGQPEPPNPEDLPFE